MMRVGSSPKSFLVQLPLATRALCFAVGVLCAGAASAEERTKGVEAGATRAVVTYDSIAQAKRATSAVNESTGDKSQIRRVALVIGNGSYQRISKLANPRNDAKDVCGVLESLQFEVTCLFDVPSRRELRESVRVFAGKLNPRSVAFFYYAGHGVQINGENFLLPTSVDARSAADIEEDGLSLSYLLRSLEEVRSSPNIVVLDACRDNPFPKLAPAGLSRGLARVDPPIGTVLAYATAPNGVALDGTDRNGLFTKHFVRHLADQGKKIDELLQVVAKEVQDEARKSGIEQVPYRSSSYSGAFCLAGCENPEIQAELEQIRLQRAEAAKRIEALAAENAQLKRQADAHSGKVRELETRIATLAREANSAGTQSSQALDEMNRLKAALTMARSEQGNSEARHQASIKREAEIAELRTRMAELQEKALEIDAYRKQLQTLQSQSDDTARRMQVLAEENNRLKRLAEEKTSNVSALEARISALTREASSAGAQSSRAQIELDQLRATLTSARQEEKEAEKIRTNALAKEREITELREQLADLQRKSQQLEDYRRQISALQKENAEKTQLLNTRGDAPRAKPVMIPSF